MFFIYKGQLAEGWDWLMVKLYKDGSYNNELSNFWICDSQFTFDHTINDGLHQIWLPNIKYDPNNNCDFGWSKFMGYRELQTWRSRLNYGRLTCDIELNIIIGNITYWNVWTEM